MRVLVNGDWNEIEEGETLESLLVRLGLDRRRVAVEHNLEIVPRSRYGGTRLADGDSLEIVHFVGGG
jgi:thiamine biosynthesis protein ThiS